MITANRQVNVVRCAIVTDRSLPWLAMLEQAVNAQVCSPSHLSRLPREVPLLIRWGTRRGSEVRFSRVINRRDALALAYSGQMSAERLRLNGLYLLTRRRGAQVSGARMFRVEVFDLQPLAVRRLIHEGGRWRLRSARATSRRSLHRATSAAVRALHALGLDAGRADVVLLPVIDGIPREGVCSVNPAPTWSLALTERVVGEIDRVLDDLATSQRRWLFGADPEFLMMDPVADEVVPASRFLPRRGRAGCDAQTHPSDPTQRPLAELRPAPQGDPLRLVRDLRNCLLNAAQRVSDTSLRWCAGGFPAANFGIGGHIHFSGHPLSGKLLRALDTYLAVPVFLVEPPDRAAARRRQHGHLGDVRFKQHGGFEYRTLPSWLLSPGLAAAVLTLAAWIAHQYQYLHRDLFLDTVLVRAFYAAEKGPFYEVIEETLADLEATPLAGKFQPLVEPLLEMVRQRRIWDESVDIRQAWRVQVSGRRRRSMA